jgi:hypothetical protein
MPPYFTSSLRILVVFCVVMGFSFAGRHIDNAFAQGLRPPNSCYKITTEVYEDGRTKEIGRELSPRTQCGGIQDVQERCDVVGGAVPINSGVDQGACRCPNGLVINRGQRCAEQVIVQQPELTAKCQPTTHVCLDEKTEGICNSTGTKLQVKTCMPNSICQGSTCMDFNGIACRPGTCVQNNLCNKDGRLSEVRCDVESQCGDVRDGQCSAGGQLCRAGVLLGVEQSIVCQQRQQLAQNTCLYPGQCINDQLCLSSGSPPSRTSCKPKPTACEDKGAISCVSSKLMSVCTAKGELYNYSAVADTQCVPVEGQVAGWRRPLSAENEELCRGKSLTCTSAGPTGSTSVLVCTVAGSGYESDCPSSQRCISGICRDFVAITGKAAYSQRCSVTDRTKFITNVNGVIFSTSCAEGEVCRNDACVKDTPPASVESVPLRMVDSCVGNPNTCLASKKKFCDKNGNESLLGCNTQRACADGTADGACNAAGQRCLDGSLYLPSDSFCSGIPPGPVAGAPAAPAPPPSSQGICRSGVCRGLTGARELCNENGAWGADSTGVCDAVSQPETLAEKRGTNAYFVGGPQVCVCNSDRGLNYPCRDQSLCGSQYVPAAVQDGAAYDTRLRTQLTEENRDLNLSYADPYLYGCGPTSTYNACVLLGGTNCDYRAIVDDLSWNRYETETDSGKTFVSYSTVLNDNVAYLTESQGFVSDEIFSSRAGTSLQNLPPEEMVNYTEAGNVIMINANVKPSDGPAVDHMFIITEVKEENGVVSYWGYDPLLRPDGTKNTDQRAYEINFSEFGEDVKVFQAIAVGSPK